MSDTYTAKKCFAENLQLFADPQSQPEKYNLYNGLYCVAQAIERREAEIRALAYEVDQIKRRP